MVQPNVFRQFEKLPSKVGILFQSDITLFESGADIVRLLCEAEYRKTLDVAGEYSDVDEAKLRRKITYERSKKPWKT